MKPQREHDGLQLPSCSAAHSERQTVGLMKPSESTMDYSSHEALLQSLVSSEEAMFAQSHEELNSETSPHAAVGAAAKHLAPQPPTTTERSLTACIGRWGNWRKSPRNMQTPHRKAWAELYRSAVVPYRKQSEAPNVKSTSADSTEMWSTSESSSEETVLCSICLEVFSEPVSTPCGHNFCKRCISEAWDTAGLCTCPLCKEVFSSRPELKVNTLLRELVSERKLDKNKSRSMGEMPDFAEVQCDVCSEPKLKALKSCLVCLSSFCETHLQPHLTVSGLKRHQLMEPVENLEDRMCPEHQRPLELFCDTDEKIVCYMCSVLEHQNHKFVSLEAACERSRSSLQQTQAHTQHMVEQRRLKLQQIQRCLELSDTEVHRERAEGLQVFTALMQSVQRRQELFLEELQEKQRLSHKRAQELVQQLEQEICELQKSSTEAEELSRSQDPLHFLQHCPALTPPAGLKEWSSVSFEGEKCEGSVARALKELEKELSEEFNKLCQQLASESNKAELRRVQKFAVDVTLDPDTAYPALVLSEDLKHVHHTYVKKQLPDSPLRFDTSACVLGKQSFSSGRFYFEVQVKGKTEWDLGVAQVSINRKGKIILGPKNGIWCIVLRNKDEYKACTDSPVRLSPARAPQKVGVFVDYDEGLVSFYDTDSADLLFSFTGCSFTEKLLPYFSPCLNDKGSNSAPLVVTAVETLTDGKKQSEAPNVKGTSADSTEMWSTSESSSEETLLCSICLEVFSEPVSTPCGHNFCKRCISEAWDTAGLCTCPLCKEVFSSRPELKVNTLLRELVSQRKLDKNKSRSMGDMPEFAEVQCDVCSEPKLKALKSCLVCLSSFCETHLQPHLTVSGLKRHQLMEPVENLEDRMCPEHQRPLELFCDTDQSCVCSLCGLLEHQNHKFVSLEAACERSRSSLQQTQAHTQHMVEQRRLKLQQIQRCLELSDTEVHRERAEGLQVFTALMQSVQRRQELFLEELQEKQRLSHKRAQELVQQLEQEICELQKSSTEAEELSRSQDPLHFLQHCPALTPPAGLKEWSSVSFEGEKCEGSVARALKELEKELSEEFKQCFKAELKRVQKFAVNVTLDPDTAYPYLVLSEDLKQVYHTDVKKQLPDSPLRFDGCACVLGKQSFSSGRFYFEVQVKGKTKWDLGVAQESINRKGEITESPKNGFWCIWLRNKDEYEALTDPSVRLSPARAPQKVGVFVDYDEGLVSFYDTDSADLLFSFTGCSFTDKLLPYYSPCNNAKGSNSAPLVVTAVETLTDGKKQSEAPNVKGTSADSTEMWSTSESSSEETVLCSICLEVFSEPVSTPCGHNFCKRCISEAWDTAGLCTCPLCKEVFSSRPELKVNTLLQVQCDVCSEPKLKALKSCLVCLSSFCETHLQPHLTVSGLKRHQLMEPVENLEDRMCPEHQRPLELFCDTDERSSATCVLLEHQNHRFVSLEAACERSRSSLQQTQAHTQHMVEQRRLKLQQIQRCLELSDTEVHRERAEGLQVFTALMQSVQRRQELFLEELQEKQRLSHKRAQELVQQLEQEICELQKSSTEAEELSRSQDPLHFLQHCPALTPPAGLKEWSSVSFEGEKCEGSVARALKELEKELSEEFNNCSLQVCKLSEEFRSLLWTKQSEAPNVKGTSADSTEMWSTSESSSEETVLCSICLEVFSEPVSTPCGHNFCKRCIKVFSSRPELKVNTLLRELVSERKLDKNKSRSKENMPEFAEVQCDVCSEPKLKALKSCLLMEPVENLEDRMCPEHQRPLELFCDTDEKIVCYMCSVLEHQNHKFVSLEAACERSRSSLQQTQAHTQHMVEQRRLKLQQIQRCLELSDTEVHRERAEGLQVFTALMQSVQRRQELFLEELQEKQRLSHKRAQELVQQLEQEICELQKSSTEAEELSRSQDPLHFLQHCPALTPPAGLKEWSSVSFEGEKCEGSVARAVKELEKELSEEFNNNVLKLS
ncbi:hypothetical protein WMY93_003227 [Mugilogobius chulae]|uniref:E3 ubiquitin-protein ligase TRIM39-like n=1 Tax=Mugilogobius chulae TaxID=88201 RepID=A0AAW0Q1S5_9GOBI